MDQFVLRALHIGVGEAGRQQTRHHVRKGRDAVHEDPEAGEGGRLGKDTTEDQAEREHQVGNVATSLSRVNTSDDHVGECRREDQEHPDKEEELETAVGDGVGLRGVVVQANGVVPAEVDDDGHERVPG